jgi:hypothetical protein
MPTDAIVRTIAVVGAAALLAAPYAGQIRSAAALAAEAVREHSGFLSRFAAALLILAAAWGKVPIPTLPMSPGVVIPEVPEPPPELRRLVEPVRAALAGASPQERAVWAEVWSKTGVVAAADAVHTPPVYSDVRSLRAGQVVALDIAWRRIAGVVPGKLPGLREATEAAFVASLGLDDVTVDAAVRGRYVALCTALAWAAR